MLLALVGLSALGIVLLPRIGLGSFVKVRDEIASGRDPSAQIVNRALLLLAAVLLILPGFVTGVAAAPAPTAAAALRRPAGHPEVPRQGPGHPGPHAERRGGDRRHGLRHPASEPAAARAAVTGDGFDPHSVPVRDAATVMLVRDGDAGLEVFMLRRTLAAVFAGGLYVFPGGAVDDADRHAEVEGRCTGRSDAEASGVLGVGAGGLAYWVAAIRECFEEAGVLLAVDGEGAVVRFDRDDVAARFVDHRRAVHQGATRLVDLCARRASASTSAASTTSATGSRRSASAGGSTPASSWPPRPTPRSRCTTTTRRSRAAGSRRRGRWRPTTTASWR